MTTKPLALQVPPHRADLGEDEVNAVAEVISSGWLTMGPKTFEFEQRFAGHLGASHAIAVSWCTTALHLALEAVGVCRSGQVPFSVVTCGEGPLA